MNDLLVIRPQPPRLVRVVKDAEACSICGGTRPILYNNGFSMVHDECARNARSARKAGIETPETMSTEEFMVKLAANEKLVRRLFRVRR